MSTKSNGSEVTSDRYPNCDACSASITARAQMHTTICNHTFHKECLAKSVKVRPFCPVCNSRIVNDGTQSTTRAQSKVPLTAQQNNEQSNTSMNMSVNNANEVLVPNSSVQASSVNVESLQEVIVNLVSAQQARLMTALTSQITEIIESNIQASLSKYNFGNTTVPSSQSEVQRTSPLERHALPAVGEFIGLEPNGTSGNPVPNMTGSHSSYSSDLISRPDKVLHIISNWRIKFCGGPNSLSIENFIYRIEALTAQTLHGNFDLLCRNAGSLFEDKASDWFWRYHRSVSNITWPSLCKALRQQYRDSRTDVDIRELIRDRKQKPNETFDSFYESIVHLTDRLNDPLSDKTLVEILRRNLLPEIQHEILNMQIYSVEHLRDTCRRREFFLQDMRRKHSSYTSRPFTTQRRIAELEEEFSMDQTTEEDIDEVSALSFMCWNCKKPGHRYQDCLAERTTFCYGCGLPDVYKPNCKKCNQKNGKVSAQRSAQKTHITPPNLETE